MTAFSANRMDSNKESIYIFIFLGWVIKLTVGNSMSNCSAVFHKKPYLYYIILFQTFVFILFNGIEIQRLICCRISKHTYCLFTGCYQIVGGYK